MKVDEHGKKQNRASDDLIGKATLYFSDSSRDPDFVEPRFVTSITRDDANQQWTLKNTTKSDVMITFTVGARSPIVYRLSGFGSRPVKYRGEDQLIILGEADWNLNYGIDARNKTLIYEVDTAKSGAIWFLENSSNELYLCFSVKFIISKSSYGVTTTVVYPGYNAAIFPKDLASQWVLLSAHFDDPDYSS